MKQYVIDFTGVKRGKEFYEAIIQGMEFPSWCGKNPDAIWDLLTGHMGAPSTVCIKGVGSLPKELADKMNMIMEIFEETVEWYAELGKVFKYVVID